jgi:hypothetical protein
MRPLKNVTILVIVSKMTDFFEVTGGRVLKNQPGSLGTEKSPSSLD